MRHTRRPADRPVFLDRSGRRRRLMRLTGVCVGAALVAVLALLTAAMSGASPVPLPGFPDRDAGGTDVGTPASPRPDPVPATTPDAETGAAPTTTTSTTTTAQPSASTKRRVPTHTPSHPRPSNPKPTKT